MIDFETFEKLIDAGEAICLKVNGNSMRPFLRHNIDRVVATKADGNLKVGDVVFYKRKSGNVVMHRIIKIESGMYWLCGDAQKNEEGPIEKNQIFAKVISIIRNGRKINENNVLYRLCYKSWMVLIPWRHLLLRLSK